MLFHRTAAIAAATMLIFAGLPGRAQFALNSPVRPDTRPARPSAEEPPKARAYKVVHGVVQGQLGALAGATVWLHGTRTLVATNADGEFELRVPADAPFIQLTCGYAGLHDEIVRLPPVQALGSVYLLRPHPIK